MYIRYRRVITLVQNRAGQLIIRSDSGEEWNTTKMAPSHSKVTDWWKMQHQGDLRQWQKDICVGYNWDVFGEVDLYVIHKKGQGFSQQHDMCLVQVPQIGAWMLATSQDLWFQKAEAMPVVFDKKDSLGSILDYDTRMAIGDVFTTLKQIYNPDNKMHV